MIILRGTGEAVTIITEATTIGEIITAAVEVVTEVVDKAEGMAVDTAEETVEETHSDAQSHFRGKMSSKFGVENRPKLCFST